MITRQVLAPSGKPRLPRHASAIRLCRTPQHSHRHGRPRRYARHKQHRSGITVPQHTSQPNTRDSTIRRMGGHRTPYINNIPEPQIVQSQHRHTNGRTISNGKNKRNFQQRLNRQASQTNTQPVPMRFLQQSCRNRVFCNYIY